MGDQLHVWAREANYMSSVRWRDISHNHPVILRRLVMHNPEINDHVLKYGHNIIYTKYGRPIGCAPRIKVMHLRF